MGVTVLGPVNVDGSGRLSPRDRVVLQALATRPGHPVSADQLMDALWGDRPPASAAKILQGCIVRLRKILGAEAITTAANGYVLAVPPDEIDAQRFDRTVARARELLSLGEADRAAYLLAYAQTLWRGAPFPDLDSWEPAVAETQRLEELRLEAEEMRAEALIQAGRHREVLAEIQALVQAQPLRERRWALLARAQYQAGNQAEALRAIHQLKSVLVRQLGIDPGPEVVALEQAILRQDPSLLRAEARTPVAGRCPYQGLRAYDVGDADRFFGRQDDVDACLQILRRTSVLAVVGPSGSGKSSILRAGVVAALRGRGHRVVLITPGAHPLEALTELPGSGDGTVLVVDQCEELFTLCGDAEERQEFLHALTTEASSRTVAIALRADRLADVTADSGFSRLVEHGLYLVGGLSEEGLRQAVEGPARQVGLVIEPGLVDLLVREVGGDPGALPLLSHALMETWKRREGNTLTVAGYRDSGGIHGAVAQSAERLYGRIETDRRNLLRDLVLRLVAAGPAGEPVRSRVPRRLVATDAEHEQLIEMLVAERLVTSDDGVLEITHEALARAWPRLQAWLDDDVEGRRILHHLSGAADAWDSLGRPDSELYRGVRLSRALEWQARTATALTATELEFLDAGRRRSEAEEQSIRDRARAQARLIHRLRLVLTGAVVLLVLALAAGGLAAVQSERASDSAAAARGAELAALARGAAARASATDDIDLGLALALAAARLDESPETLSGLMAVLAKQPALVRSAPLAGSEAMALDVHPDGRTAAVVDTNHRVRLLDLDTGAQLADRQAGPTRIEIEEVRVLRFSPDGRVLAVGEAPLAQTPLTLLDGETLRPLPDQPSGGPPGDWQLTDLAFSRNGQTMAAVLNRIIERGDERQVAATSVRVWDLDALDRPRTIDVTSERRWASAALSPDGRFLYTATPEVRVHDLRSGQERQLSAGADYRFGALEVSPDGRTLAVAKDSLGQTQLLDSRTGRVRNTLTLPGQNAHVRFSDDGRRVITAIWHDREAAVWDVRSGRQLTQLSLGEGNSGAVDLNPTGTTVLTAGPDNALRWWDVDGEQRYLRRIPIAGLPWSTEFGGACVTTTSSGGAYVNYQLCPDGVARLERAHVVLDVATRRAHAEQPAGNQYSFGAGSWDASEAEYLQSNGGTIWRWDGRTGRATRGPHPGGDRVVEIDHSPDGSRVAMAELSGRVTLLDGDSLQPLGTPVDVRDAMCCVSLGPDNRTAFVLIGGPERTFFWNDGTTRWALVDLLDGRTIRAGELGFPNGTWAAYSPDGGHLAAGGYDGEVLIIDASTGQPVRPPERGHRGLVAWAAFSPDGSRLVSAATDGSVILWNTETGSIAARVSLPQSVLSSPEFLPDGRSVLIVPWWQDPAVYVWDPSPERAYQFACRAAARQLTEVEWREHFGDEPYRETCPPP